MQARLLLVCKKLHAKIYLLYFYYTMVKIYLLAGLFLIFSGFFVTGAGAYYRMEMRSDRQTAGRR